MADEQTLDEYSAALDRVGPDDDDGPEEAEDTGATALATAEALGLTEAPVAKGHALLENHPEIWPDYEEAVLEKLVIKDAYPPTTGGHTTYPFLTMYEKTKVLSLRASQLARGAPPYIDVPEYLTDVYEIARAELEAKRLPFIVKRPLPDGKFEYWRLADLMVF
jgi:DNA-directed RNA polymerase I, II, and III subunit RPABC2